MDGTQMKQLKLSLDTLDRLGLLPNKAKDIAKKEGTGRLIDLVPGHGELQQLAHHRSRFGRNL